MSYQGLGRNGGGEPSTEFPPCPGGSFMMPDGTCVQANCAEGLVFDSITHRCVPLGHTVKPSDMPSAQPPPQTSFVDTTAPDVFTKAGITKASMPWLIGGGIAIALVALTAAALSKPADEHQRRAAANRRRARPNPRRPPKKWFDDCVSGVEASGSASDPYSVCGALWHRKMGKKAKAKALRAERSR